MQLSDDLLKSFAKITNDKEKRKDDSVPGTVVINGGETYVQIDGSDALTPVTTTSSMKNEDRVLVTIKNHKAILIGNFTDPSASTTTVNTVSAAAAAARELAEQAGEAADEAQTAANAATTAANTAQQKADAATTAANTAISQAAAAATSANEAKQQATAATTSANEAKQQATAATTSANEAKQQATAATTSANEAKQQANTAAQQAERADKYANSALDQLGVVQDVVGVLSWASEHGSFAKTTDQELQNGKVYFTYDGTDYTPVVTPDASQLSNYYELTVDEAMQSYIMAHLAVTNRGLWVLPSGINTGSVTPASGETEADARARLGSNYKVLLSNSGMTVYDGSGVEVAVYGESIEFNSSRPQYIGGEDAYIMFYDADNDGVPDSIRIGGDNVFIESDQKLSDVLNRTRYQAALSASGTITPGHIICGISSGYRNLGAGVSFDLSYPLLYAGSSTGTGVRDNNYTAINDVLYTTTGSITAGAAGKTLYLIGSVSGNTFVVAAAPFLTTTIPTSENNLYYIPLGVMTSSTVGYFLSSNRLYAYINGAFQPVDKGAAAIATATKQYFWHDTNGAHIGTVQGDGNSGYNSLWNSNGLLLRKDTYNLAAFTGSDVSFYDGYGNASGNIVAKFGRNGITLGTNSKTQITITAGKGLTLGESIQLKTDGTAIMKLVDVQSGNISGFTIQKVVSIDNQYPLYSEGKITATNASDITVDDTTHIVTIVNDTVVTYTFDPKIDDEPACYIYYGPYHTFTGDNEPVQGICTIRYYNGSECIKTKTYTTSYRTAGRWYAWLDQTVINSTTSITVSFEIIADSTLTFSVGYGVNDAITYNTTHIKQLINPDIPSVYYGTNGISVSDKIALLPNGTIQTDYIEISGAGLELFDSNDERDIHITNTAYDEGKTYADDGVYPHATTLYGGSATSRMAIGVWDRRHKKAVWRYDDHNELLRIEQPTVFYSDAQFKTTAGTVSAKSFYKEANDTWTVIVTTAGFVTSSGTEYRFTVPTPYVNGTLTVTSITGVYIRTANGGTVSSNITIPSGNITVYKYDFLAQIRFTLSTAPSGILNNAPVGLQATITFEVT